MVYFEFMNNNTGLKFVKQTDNKNKYCKPRQMTVVSESESDLLANKAEQR